MSFLRVWFCELVRYRAFDEYSHAGTNLLNNQPVAIKFVRGAGYPSHALSS